MNNPEDLNAVIIGVGVFVAIVLLALLHSFYNRKK